MASTDARLWGLLRPHRGKVLFALLCAGLSALGMGAYAFLAGPAARALVQGGSLDLGSMGEGLLPEAVVEAFSRSLLGAVPMLLIAAALFRAITSAGFNLLISAAVVEAAGALRSRVFDRLLRGDPAFFDAQGTGELVSRIGSDIATVEQSGQQVAITLSKDVSQALALLLVCASIDLRLFAASTVVVAATVVPTKRFADALRGIGKEQLAALAEIGRKAEQMLRNHRIILAYGSEAHRIRGFAEANENLLSIMRRSLLWRAAYTPLMEVMGVIGLAAAIAWAGRSMLQGSLPPESVLSFAAAALMLYQPLKAIGTLGQQLAQLRGAAERCFELLDAPDAVVDRPGATELPPPREVRLEKVTVRYGEKVALREVDLCLRAGETVALVGESGAGKSTIANLLLRFVEPAEGRVTFDGKDIREASLASLRASIGYVPQETVLFAGDAKTNLSCGAKIPLERLEAAARAANAEAVIEAIGGYEGDFAEGGKNLSGGERQRVGVARALARDARILILDEPTSALDAENDALLQEAFARALAGDRIGLLITHRLRSLSGVDRVVVLAEGRVVEEGRPEELVARGGRFAQMLALEAA